MFPRVNLLLIGWRGESSALAATKVVSTPGPGLGQSASISAQPQTPAMTTPKGRPGLTDIGINLSAAPVSDGSFDIAESVIVSAPMTTLQLRLPTIREGGSIFRSMNPRATAVQISADKQPLTVPDGECRCHWPCRPASLSCPIG